MQQDDLIDNSIAHKQRMRRCFMTGRACIFQQETSKEKEAFAVMPFQPNLNALYSWELERQLPNVPKLTRADKLHNVSYIMCTSICRKIQDSLAVVVDLSIDNPNVFYELGLSVGLGKQLVLLCQDKRKRAYSDQRFHAVGIKPEWVLEYSGLGDGLAEKFRDRELTDQAHTIPLAPRNSKMKIVALVQPDKLTLPEESNDKPSIPLDINVSFADSTSAAVRVAMKTLLDESEEEIKKLFEPTSEEIKAETDEAKEFLRRKRYETQLENLTPLAMAIHYLDPDYRGSETSKTKETSNEKHKTIEELRVCEVVRLATDDGRPEAFETVADSVDSAFTCIVDLKDEDIFSYFWLGYCHARGINVIPVYRSTSATPKQTLAFDIRALWYMAFPKELTSFCDTLMAVFKELIIRDIPFMQRKKFWDRLGNRGLIDIFTGAIHNPDLARESVGDWDVRTVSELVRYLASRESSALPQLRIPIYWPSTIDEFCRKHTKKFDTRQYIEWLKVKLKDKSCLVIASADVNPLTELILASAYTNRLRYTPEEIAFGQKGDADLDFTKSVIAVKRLDTFHDVNKPRNSGDGGDRTFYYLDVDGKYKDEIKAEQRGFLVDGKGLASQYYSQWAEEIPNEKFSIFAHLIIMKNEFSTKDDGGDSNDIIVVLDGVTGPATYGLAELLTGGTEKKFSMIDEHEFDSNRYIPTPKSKALQSEKILKEINDMWEEWSVLPEFRGLEAFVEVIITKLEPQRNIFSSVEYAQDFRIVTGWELCNSDIIKFRNPRIIEPSQSKEQSTRR